MAQYCQSCGSTLDEGAQFCRACGAAQTVQPQQQEFASPYAAPYAQPTPVIPPQPSYYANPAQQSYPPVGVGEYIVMLILSGIPIIGLILLISWAFGSQVNPSKRNFARAVLLLGLIGIVLAVLLSATLVPMMYSLIESMEGYTY